MPVGFDVTNQKASPALYASSLATRPAASFVGRLFVDTDTPSTGIYRDTGTVWLSISGGSSETQSLNDVCVIGNTTTTLGILINGQSTVGTHDSSSSSIPPEADFALTIGEDYPATGFSIYTTHKNHFAGVLRNEGTVVFDTLGGTGSRIVVASADGTLTASAALSSYVTGSGTTNYVPKFTSASAIGNSVIVENGGNIGIGETNPISYQLQVKGADGDGIQYEDANGVRTLLGSYLSKAIIGTLTNHAAGFWANNSEKMILFTSGNLAINSTTDAGYKLDVNGTGSFSNAVNVFGGNLSHAANKTTLSQEGSSNGAFWQSYGADASTKGKFTLRQNSSDGSISAIPLSIDTTGAATFSSSVSVGNFTTVQKNALTGVAGMVVYDTTLNKLCVYTTAWETITSI